jgi:DNA replication factor GINS
MISYDDVRRIHRLEKNSSRLVDVNQEFYSDLQDFVQDEKKKYLSKSNDSGPVDSRDFVNLKKMVEEIFSMREKKIMNAALVASHTGEPLEEGMTLQERKLFKQVFELLRSHKALLNAIFCGVEKSKGCDTDLNNLSVEILSDIPAFVGTDMKEYGPFKKGAVVVLPAKIAKVLLQSNLVEVKS